jgi:iron(III) transport system substrate-binding protein
MRRLLPALLGLFASFSASAADELVVYSARIEDLIRPIFDRYTAETGTKIQFITDKEGPLMQRLLAEGDASPADLLLTVDAGNLWQAAKVGVLQQVKSPTLEANIPAHLRDPDGWWFGMSVRARTIVYSTQRVKPAQLSTYEALAGPEWKGKLCLRTSKKVYNQSLVGVMMQETGDKKAEEIVRGWVANLAAPPFASDNEEIDAIVAGRCDVAIVNTYYFGRMVRDKPDLPAKLFWPNQSGAPGQIAGVHVNVSGVGVTKHAPHRDAAVKFIEWLSGREAQGMFGSINLEFPANAAVAPDPLTASWGSFKQDSVNLAVAGQRQADAVRLMDRAGWR